MSAPTNTGAGYGSLAFLLMLVLVLDLKAEPGRMTIHGDVPANGAGLTPTGRLTAARHLQLAIGLPLRNEPALDELLSRVYDPRSTNFHRFLTPQEFTARFGPTEQDYQAVREFAEASGLRIVGTHPNRLVLDVEGSGSNVEQAFRVTLRTYRHPTEAREFFAPDTAPSVPTNLPVADMWGLSDYGLPRPLSHPAEPLKITPLDYNGSGPGGAYQGSDFRNAYVPGVNLTGAGQIAALAEFDGYYPSDITNYEAQCGYTNNVPLQDVLLDGVSGTPGYSGVANAVAEVSLDIELIIAMAPGLSKLIVYEGNSPYDVFNKIVTDNSAKQISCSWAFSYGPNHNWIRRSFGTTLDSQLKQMAAQGQSFFQASGDSDAYTGSGALSTSSGPVPMDSIYVTSVGGTTLTMNGVGASWSSETVWNWGNNTGSGGGVSPNYAIPSWQAGVNMTANSGSTVKRNIPDVALTADAVEVLYNNNSSGAFGGTSCAAPLWAGFCALVNQQSVAARATTVGFLNPALYTIAAGTNYNACFHDITTGNNTGANTPGLYNAVAGYDLATGLGTPNGVNLINALAPPPLPYFLTEPTNLTILSGSNAVFSAAASGSTPLAYQWCLNGTNLPNGAGISGATTSTLTLVGITTNSSGNYTLAVSNIFGVVTSSVAALTVVLPPAIDGSLTNQTIECGSSITFAVTASGTPPLEFQWHLDGEPVSGATNSSLSLTNVHLPDHAVTLIVANPYAALASNAVLTVQDTTPPFITVKGDNPIYVELGSTFSDPGATAYDICAGPVPVSTSGIVNPNAVGTSIVAYIADDGNGNTNIATRAVVVRDTTPPVILWSFTNLVLAADTNCDAPMPDVTGTNFIVATDLSGMLTISQCPTNNTQLPLGTNMVVITVEDASSNAAYSTNAIVVQDQTPPQILSQPQSQTNLVGATATFSVGAVACTPLAFQWWFNNVALDAGTNSTLTLSNITATSSGNYSVVATAAGGFSSSAVATLTVTSIFPGIPSVTANPDGSFTLNLTGLPDYTYVLEATPDLSSPGNWQPVTTNTLDGSGAWQYTDALAPNFPQRFYRLRLAQ